MYNTEANTSLYAPAGLTFSWDIHINTQAIMILLVTFGISFLLYTVPNPYPL